VLPRLTDSTVALEAVVRAAAEHGAQWLWSGTLHLEPPVRDWLLAALQRHFPQSVAAYARVFGTPGDPRRTRYTPPAYSAALGQRVAELKARYGLGEQRQPGSRPAMTAQPDAPPKPAVQQLEFS
jgi:hypothetical protein